MKDFEFVTDNCWRNCIYCECTYREHDTGYSEYGCELTGAECWCDEGCPLVAKVKVTFDEN